MTTRLPLGAGQMRQCSAGIRDTVPELRPIAPASHDTSDHQMTPPASRSSPASGRIAGSDGGSSAVVCAGDVSAPVVAGAATSSPPVRTTWTIAATAIPPTRRNSPASSQRGRLTPLAGADSRPAEPGSVGDVPGTSGT